eukprot:6010682-Pyramimonas_sp.AAC.1
MKSSEVPASAGESARRGGFSAGGWRISGLFETSSFRFFRGEDVDVLVRRRIGWRVVKEDGCSEDGANIKANLGGQEGVRRGSGWGQEGVGALGFRHREARRRGRARWDLDCLCLCLLCNDYL